jgi:2,3-bisphosphoglycerate-independent phosphoglycerate mutase
MDGCGYTTETYGNAIRAARTPNLDALMAAHPFTTLGASGPSVGLPEGQMGNSEVGHLNIGAGRIVEQDLTIISKAIDSGAFFSNAVLSACMDRAATDGRSLHLMGLIGPGGVHAVDTHLRALVEMAGRKGLSRVYIHAFLDGRDTPPRSAAGYMEQLENMLAQLDTGRVVSVSGRYYAMDRDKRWERVQKAYDALTAGTGLKADSSQAAIKAAYDRGENDEFVSPTNVAAAGETPVTVADGDSVVFFNFRPDRARELTRAFTDPDFDGFTRQVKLLDISFVTLTEYDATMPGVQVAFPPEVIPNTLGEYLSSLGLKQLRIAETEKYPHVTFFFNGGVEVPGPDEDRILIPSPKVATYDLKPEMSAYLVTDAVVAQIESGKYDVIILNFANMDMVGHTGVFDAAIKAVETVDECVGRIAGAVQAQGGQLLITADHGNSDTMLTPKGEPITAHSLNPVPLILIRPGDSALLLKEGGVLSDIAPTLLEMMELPQPKEMTGTSLIERKGA